MKQSLVVGAVFCGVGLLVGLVVGADRRSMRMEPTKSVALFGASGSYDDAPGAPPPAPEAALKDEEEAKESAERMRSLSMKRRETIQIIKGGRGAGYGAGAAMQKPKMAMAPAMEAEVAEEPSPEPQAGGEGGPGAAQSRAWFPETFLFEPLVVTDGAGLATVPVKVPDRLTQWRVLALAHSRSGAQAGAVTRFAGTLPTYVDPVLPGFLRAGDVVRLPVQVVNTTSSPVEQPLKLTADGATVEGGGRTVRVPARGSVVEYVTLRTATPGKVTVRATLGGADSVVRTLDVQPTGRPVFETRGGSLAAPRTLKLEGPSDAQAGSERVRLLVYPGALGMLRSELSAVSKRRPGAAEDAYALLLAGRAPELLKTLGETPDAEALKTLAQVAGQRALRASRVADVATASLLAEAALAHPENPVLERLGERMAAQVAQAQRPDGTCQGADGWTLQRLLVATSECAQAVRAAATTEAGRQRAASFTTRAAGAFERNLSRVQDGYTAAALLASGGVSGSMQDELRQRVREALKTREDGAAYLPVEAGVVRGDGSVPSEVEATALAVLALQGDAKAPLADLGTSLLAGYSPMGGWGDGRTNLVGLRAALALFKDPLPSHVRVVLERDGKVVTEGTLDAKALRDVLALEAPASGSAGVHTWTVRAEPAVPGLGFSLTLGAYVPWKLSESRGLEFAVKGPTEAKVGLPVDLTVQAAFPPGLPLTLRQGLPAGVQVDPASLDALVAEGKVTSYDVEDGAVTLHVAPRSNAEPFQARMRVVPTLAGTLQGGASSLASESRPDATYYVPPATWAVR